MPYSEKLADRIRIALMDVPRVEEKKMFRGLTFMVDDKMCISIGPDRIMCRIDPELHDQLLEEHPCRGMIMKGKEYKGYILVNEEDLGRNKDLDFWIGLCLDFNARAKSSKKPAKAAKGGIEKTPPAPKGKAAKAKPSETSKARTARAKSRPAKSGPARKAKPKKK